MKLTTLKGRFVKGKEDEAWIGTL